MIRLFLFVSGSLVLLHSARAELPVADLNREKPVDFASEVYPFLKSNCLACHNTTKAKAGLILESPAAMIKGGDSGPAIEPGDAENSLLFITSAHLDDPVMPPPNNKSKAKDLTPLELALLKQWINEGAEGESVATPAPESWSLLDGVQPIYASAITPDGHFAAVGRGQKIHLYDLRLGKIAVSLRDPDLKHPTAHRDIVQSLAFSRDGILASGGFRTAKIWKRRDLTGSETHLFPGEATCSCLSEKGNSAAFGLKDGAIALIDLRTEERRSILVKDHKAAVADVAFSTDESWIYSVSADKTLSRRSLLEISETKSVSLPAAGTTMAFFDKGKQILIARADQNFQFCSSDLAPGATFKLEESPVLFLKKTEGEGAEFVAGFENGIVILFQLNPDKTPKEIRRFTHGGPINQIACSKTRLATVGTTGSVFLWNLADGKKIVELKGDPNSQPQQEVFTREITVANRVKSYWDKKGPESEKLWKSESEKAKQSGETIAKARRDIAAKKKALAALESKIPPAKEEEIEKARAEIKTAVRDMISAIRSRDSSSRLAGEALTKQNLALARSLEAETLAAALKTELEEVKKVVEKAATEFAVVGLAFSSDESRLLAALKNGGLRIYSAETGKWVEDHATVSGSGKILTTKEDEIFLTNKDRKTVSWKLPGKHWQLVRTLGDGKSAQPFSDRVSALEFHPEGTQLLIGSGVPSRRGEITLWDASTWNLIAENREAHDDSVTSFAFSPGGTKFVSGATDRMVKIFETNSLEHQKTFEGHSAHILDVDWNADDLSIVSCGADPQVKTWDIAAVKEKSKLTSFQKEVVTASYVGGTESVLTASGDKSLKIGNSSLSGSGTTFLHTAGVSADGKTIIAAGRDSVLRIWDGSTRKIVMEFASPDSVEVASE